ncbi:hypothetical protein A9P82_01615 [Arachidicoccus ginsenosidimutans]|uniref:glycosyltransferase n=1 Tax=Arachidicoccus sp. BS20 TaxID=1850526 RepID=UPI0007F071B1|nr:glycosyltransferase [Arachidicoccus sp. BS20]ANI88121.1 hypothetical protein A9P82_01615 [Arachidicoccus sp. BS20]
MSNQGTICFFNSANAWGGGEKWHYDAAMLMHKNGCRVLVITSPGSALQQRLPKGIECSEMEVGNLSYLNFSKIKKLKNIFLQHSVNIVVINLSEDLKLAGIAAKRAKVERIIYRRGSAIPLKNHFINRYYFKNILTNVLANSEATKQTVLQNNPNLFPSEKIKVIYNPIDTKEFIERNSSPVYEKEKDELVLANIGRLVKQKNQKFLIDIAGKLKEKNVPFRLYITGDGRLEEELKNYVQEKNVSQEVIFTGFLKNVKDVLMCCDIFLLSSLWEGFGYVLAEASLCKKAIVAFNTSSNPELVVNNETGFLTEVNNVEEFSDKIIELYNNQTLLKSLGDKGFEYILENFSVEKIEQQLLNYLSE